MEKNKYVEFYSERLPDGRTAIFRGKRPKPPRERQARWDKTHYMTLSCRVPIATAERFKEACQRAGKTPYMVLKEYVKDYM